MPSGLSPGKRLDRCRPGPRDSRVGSPSRAARRCATCDSVRGRADRTANLVQWVTRVGPAFRAVFLSGVEGLPQTRQKRFAERWAELRLPDSLLLPHGTDALRLALAAVLDHDGLDYGGEVIVPNLSFIATATAASTAVSASRSSTSTPAR